MISPSADAARALTQVAVVALLCRRYHDLATWASEPLKQRIHFLAKADGSNLEELYIWDSPQHLTREKIFGFLHQHWSPDQLPLAPPEGAAAWEAALVYRKKFDQETIQGLVPIGRIASDPADEEASLLAMVLYAEQGVQDQEESPSGGRKQGENGLCWKYHNVVLIQQRDLVAQQWELMSDTCHVPMNKSLTKSPTDTPHEAGKEDDEGDSDDDYWGQYGDEDSLSDEEEASAQHNRKRTEGKDDEDDEDEYWHKYSQQQEKEEAAETKRKMEQSSRNIPEIAPPQASSLPGHVDSTMLSSLFQMLVQEGIQQSAAEEIQDASPPQDDIIPTITAIEIGKDRNEELTTTTTTTTASTVYLETPPVCSQSIAEDLVTLIPSQAKAMVSITLDAAVRQAALEGLSKEQVFALLENVYQSRSSE
ncbi:hypothetical protein BGZ93_006853 [Podila epicladia]|nr:hypothetical protein BGZ92_007492 [Podila epicladia]KAG0099611.1 hypothetical protein BGZ93_006853 [Podila epicladia]